MSIGYGRSLSERRQDRWSVEGRVHDQVSFGRNHFLRLRPHATTAEPGTLRQESSENYFR